MYIFICIKRILDVSRARQRQAVSRCPGQGSSTSAWSFAPRPTRWNTARQGSRLCDPTPRGRQRTAGQCRGVPEAAADIDVARKFKWSHVPVQGIQREIQ